MFNKVDESNFLLYAAKHYDNPQCFDTVEFYDDLNRFKYLKRLFNKYIETGDIKERLIINHIVILYNVFGVEASNRMLFLKLKGYEKFLKPFLIFLNNLPDVIYGINENGENIHTNEIPLDQKIIDLLRKI